MISRGLISVATALSLVVAVGSAICAEEGMRLDGKSPIFAAESTRSLNLKSDLTLEAWIKADRMSGGGGRILDKSTPGSQNGYMLDTFPGNSLRLLNATGMCKHDAKLPADKWTHVVGVFSVEPQLMKLYVDGSEVSTIDSGFVPMRRSREPLCIGADPKGGNRFRGRIKRAAIYERALTAEEITKRSAEPIPASLQGVLGEWVFSEKPGKEIKPIAGQLVLRPLSIVSSSDVQLSGEATPPAEPLSLWYRQPAAKWSEALAIGNGRLGAMVFGGLDQERLQFNEDTVWTGEPREYHREGAADKLAEIRKLLYEGKQREAETLAMKEFMSDPLRQKAYQPFGDVLITFPEADQVSNYRRDLNLDTAVASVSYQVGDTSFVRSAFVSRPDQAIVWNMRADKPGKVSFTVRLDSAHRETKVAVENERFLTLTGQVTEGAIHFKSVLHVDTTGGSTTYADDAIHVKNANAATLVLVAATNFKDYSDVSADPAARCQQMAKAVAGKDYETLLKDNLADHQKLFRRVTMDLGTTPSAKLPTDERLKKVAQEADPQLDMLYFQFGRYLLITSSRSGSQPANLQGIWNESLRPPWESKWTVNINTEMNYWPAEVCNLSECHEPLFDMIDDCAVTGAKTAKAHYNCGGWVLHHNTDVWRGTAPINHSNHGIWVTGGAWLCQHLWERYLFTEDKEFLKSRAYPAMKGASQFFLDFLVRDKKDWVVD